MAFAADWETRFRETCKYDSYCKRLKESDGTWLKPKPEIVQLLKNPDIQKEIKMTAEKYGVSPLAIAGSILAENSLNVGVKDSVQNLLASKLGITSIAGKQFTVGLGQINVMTAMEADAHLPKIEGRPPKTLEQMTKEVTDPISSIRVVGTILRKVQDDYKDQGFDISKDPAILTTLYNLGKSEEKAKDAKEAGRQPKANYFGLFVEKYSDDINKYIGTSSSSKSLAVKEIAPVPVEKVSKVAKAEKAVAKTESKSIKMEKIDTVSSSLSLATHPLECQDSISGQNTIGEAKSMAYGAPSGVLEANQGYSEVSRGFDCKSNVWKLLKSESGAAGWVSEDALNRVKTSKYEEQTKCSSSKADANCLDKIKKSAPNFISQEDQKAGLIYLKPVTAPNVNEASFKEEDRTCGYEMPETEGASSGSRQPKTFNGYTKFPMGNFQTQGKVPEVADLESSAKQVFVYVQKIRTNMQTATGLSQQDLTGPQNPYAPIAAGLDSLEGMARKCIQSISTETMMCSDFSSVVKKLDKATQYSFKKDPSLDEVMQARAEVSLQGDQSRMPVYSQSNYSPRAGSRDAYSSAEIKESLKACKERLLKIADLNSNASMQTGSAQSGGGMTIQMNPTIQEVQYFLAGVENSSDDQIKEYGEDLSRFANFCHGRLNLVGKENVSDKYSCLEARPYIMHNYQIFARNLVAESYKKNPGLVILDVANGLGQTVDYEVIDKFVKKNNLGAKGGEMGLAKEIKSYCPNKTAEFITEMLKNNNCIQRVYMPSKLLVKKLSDQSSKVLFREFEKDGVYAVEFKGANQCK